MRPHAQSVLLALLSAGLCVSGAFPVQASAWVRFSGNGQVIVTAAVHRATERFDLDGDRTDQATYTRLELNPYFEYGLTDKITIGANSFVQRVDTGSGTRFGMGDTELFMRGQLYRSEKLAVAVQPFVKLPGPSAKNRQPTLGSEGFGGGMDVYIGGNARIFTPKADTFWMVGVGYNMRGSGQNDQLRGRVAVGNYIDDNNMLLAEYYLTTWLREPRNATFTNSPGDDYVLHKVQGSWVYKLNETQRVQFGVNAHAAGRNTDSGIGVFAAFWQEF